MPLQIQRTATVYRLWDDDDLLAMFDAHAEAGWLSRLECSKPADQILWQVGMQTPGRPTVVASRSDVVVSDLVTVVAQTLDDYNAANPDNPIEEGS